MPDVFAQYAAQPDPFAAYAAPGPIPAEQQAPLPSYLGDVARYAGGEVIGAAKKIPGLITGPLAFGKDLLYNSYNTETGGPLINIARGLRDEAKKIWAGDPEAMGGALLTAATMKAPAAEGSGLPAIPAGRILSAGITGMKAGAAKIPFVGPPIKGFIRGAVKSWKDSAPAEEVAPSFNDQPLYKQMERVPTRASGPIPETTRTQTPPPRPDVVPVGGEEAYNAGMPKPAATPDPLNTAYQQILDSGGRFTPVAERLPVAQPQAVKVMPEGAGPMPSKPHLSAQEFLRMQRQEFGADQAARNMVPKTSPELSRAQSVDWVRESAPMENTLPNAVRRKIEQQLSGMTPEQAWDYVQRAPNTPARDYFMMRLKGR